MADSQVNFAEMQNDLMKIICHDPVKNITGDSDRLIKTSISRRNPHVRVYILTASPRPVHTVHTWRCGSNMPL